MEGLYVMKDVLKAFGAAFGLPDLAPDEDGYACLSVDGVFVIHLVCDEESDSLRVFCELCEFPPSHETEVMRALLDANVLWRGSGGATLGLDFAKKVVTLAYQAPIGTLTSAHFEHIFEAFIVTGERWIERVAGIARACVDDQAFDGVARAPADDAPPPALVWGQRA